MRAFRKGLVAVTAAALALGGASCSKYEVPQQPPPAAQSNAPTIVEVSIEPVEVLQAKPPPQAIMANLAVTYAVNQYVQARLLTEAVTTADFERADAKGLASGVMEALVAWDDALALAEEAAELTSVVADDLGEPSRESSKDRRGRDRGEQAWTAPFSKPFDPTDVVLAQADLLADIQDDIDSLTDAMEDLGDILNGRSNPTGRDLRDAESIADDAHDMPVVDLAVASTGLPGGGSISELLGSDASVGRDRVVLTGVDAIAMVGSRSSSLMVGANQQVVVEEEDLPRDASDVDVVLGIADLAPSTNVDPRKEVPNVSLPIGSTPSTWIYSQTLLSIQVVDISIEPTLILVEIPTGNVDAEEDALNVLGVPIREAPDATPTDLVEDLWIDPGDAIMVIDDMFEELEPEPVKEEPKKEPKKEQPKQEAPKQEPAAPDVTGTYSWYLESMDGDSSGTATLYWDGDLMVLQMGGDPILGTWDFPSQTFTAHGQFYSVTLTFTTSSVPYTAYGNITDGYANEILTMVKQ